jgi:hypothetical protein
MEGLFETDKRKAQTEEIEGFESITEFTRYLIYGHIILKLYVQSFRKVKHGSVCERVYMSIADRVILYLTIWIYRFHEL